MTWDECHENLLMICQHLFVRWLGAIKQHAITWANVVPALCLHIAPLVHDELNGDEEVKHGREIISMLVWLISLSKRGPALLWRHNGRDSVSNHQPQYCLLNRSFRRRSKNTSKLRVTDFCAGNSPVTGEFARKWPVAWKVFPFDDVIMILHSVTNALSLCKPYTYQSCH